MKPTLQPDRSMDGLPPIVPPGPPTLFAMNSPDSERPDGSIFMNRIQQQKEQRRAGFLLMQYCKETGGKLAAILRHLLSDQTPAHYPYAMN